MGQFFTTDGVRVTPGDIIATSGEATIYRVEDDLEVLFKCYHGQDPKRAAKLERMLEAPPRDPSLSPYHRALAWPLEAVLDEDGVLSGVLIPAVPNARTLSAIASPKLRRTKAPEIDGYHLHAVGANLAFLLSLLHEQGVVVGDLKPDNILVDDRALVTLVDCDSLQIPGANGEQAHLCLLGSEGMTPPEWIGRDFSAEPRSETADRFGLAVVLYQLLMGSHPWNGTWAGPGEPPARDHLIASGDWPYRPNARLQPAPNTLPLTALTDDLTGLFQQAFIDGHDNPSARPTAVDWHHALCNALAELETCDSAAEHYRAPGSTPCPWCELGQTSGVALFNEDISDRDPYAPLTLAFERSLARGDARMANQLWRENKCLRDHPALARHRARVDGLSKAIKAFDRWAKQYRDNPSDVVSLLSTWESDPDLGGEIAILDETVDGRNVLKVITELRDQTLDIPEPPSNAPIAADPTAVTQTLPDPTPTGLDAQAPVEVRYRVVPGWHGLRPARIRFNVKGRVWLPGFDIIDQSSGLPLGRIDPVSVRDRIEIPFEQPAWRARVKLVVHEQDSDRPIHLIDPPAREAMIGAPAATPKPIRPRRVGAILHA